MKKIVSIFILFLTISACISSSATTSSSTEGNKTTNKEDKPQLGQSENAIEKTEVNENLPAKSKVQTIDKANLQSAPMKKYPNSEK